jgi:uncharacterized repeat protein (TIGR02543 family)
VSSAHGSPIGQGWYNAGVTANAGLASGTVSGGAGTQYVFTGWSADASGSAFSSSNAITMNGPKTATANWKTQYQVTFALSGGGSNSPTGSNVWENAGSLSITATPNAGSTFSSWSSNTGSITFSNANSASATATIGGTGTITATFAIIQYTITVTQTTNGVIASGTSTVDFGATPSFTITPDAGYYIASITANGVAVSVISPAGQSYQFSAVSTDGSLTATFAINTYTLTTTPIPTATPTPTPAPTATPSPTPSPTPLYLVLAVVIIAVAIIISVIAIKRSRRKPDNTLPNPEN